MAPHEGALTRLSTSHDDFFFFFFHLHNVNVYRRYSSYFYLFFYFFRFLDADKNPGTTNIMKNSIYEDKTDNARR